MKPISRVFVAMLLLLSMNTSPIYGQRSKEVIEDLSKLAKYVSIASAGATMFHWFAPPPVTDKISIGSREGWFSTKRVLILASKATDPDNERDANLHSERKVSTIHSRNDQTR